MIINRRNICLLAGLTLGGCATAAPAPETVELAGFVPIGGIDQWIELHGEDRRNPVILVVHGGPGEAQWPAAAYYRPWQRRFTVAQWDQRGAGRTYGRYGDKTADVNLDRIARDGLEVAEHLRRTLGKKKIIVLGHSWGSIVATRMVQMRPELFAAYVGTGQVASWPAVVQAQFDALLAKARSDKDQAAVASLEAIGKPDPKNVRQFFTLNRNLINAMGVADQTWIKSLRSATAASLGISEEDFKSLNDGMGFSARSVLPDMMAADLPATAASFDMPYFLIQGREDITTPTGPAVAYFDRLKAPVKERMLIEGAGHFAFMTSSQAFLAALTDKVRPVALARGA
jgi:pimeloyl-ACP methyl ester carboxylesterase